MEDTEHDPVEPDRILRIWRAIKGLDDFGEWEKTYGVCAKMSDVRQSRAGG